MSYTIYHNPRCSKSRLGLAFLKEKGIEPTIIEYLKVQPSKEELKTLISKLSMKPIELMRKGEADYKNEVKGKDLSDDELIEKMIKFPKLIERPIIVKGNNAVIARPTEKIEELL